MLHLHSIGRNSGTPLGEPDNYAISEKQITGRLCLNSKKQVDVQKPATILLAIVSTMYTLVLHTVLLLQV